MGEETGLRGIEITRIHESDVSLTEQKIRVRNPTKNLHATTVCFGSKTRKYLEAWKKKRPKCDHKFLFTNAHGDPLSREALWSLLNHVLCKEARGRREVYEIGLDSFNYHRLRHTNTTNLNRGGMGLVANMKQHNWKQPSAALGYMDISLDEQTDQFHQAMARLSKAKKKAPEPKSIPLDEYLANTRKKVS